MKDLTQLRQEIDNIDAQLVALFEQRMALTHGVGEYKLARGIPVLDSDREEQVLESKAALLHDKALAPDVTELFQTIMAISRRQQAALMEEHS
jgi:chorismate mutase/prephenate dehydratase